MSAQAEQPSLDLGDYRGQGITDVGVKILNQTGGFDPSTDLAEPRIFEMDEEFTIAARVKVTDHNIKRILAKKEDDPDRLRLLMTLVMGTVAVVPDTGVVKKELDRVADAAAQREKAREAAKAAKPKRGPQGEGKVVSIGSSLAEASQSGTFE